MKWDDLLLLVGNEPFFESSILLAGEDSPKEVRRQLSRWTAGGRLIQLRRGLYAFARPHARTIPHPLAVAGVLRRPSYVSLVSALAFHGLIPESVPVATSVTTIRPGTIETPLGTFLYRHLQRSLFWGYRQSGLGDRQAAFIALPEKALLDLFYLTPGAVSESFVQELRLEAAGSLDPTRLKNMAERTGKPKLVRAAALTAEWLFAEREGEVEI